MEWSWASHEFSILTMLDDVPTGPPLVATWIRGLSAEDSAPTTVVIGPGAVVLGRTDPGVELGTGTITVLPRPWRLWAALQTGAGAMRLSALEFKVLIKARAGITGIPQLDEVQFAFTTAAEDIQNGSSDPRETALTVQVTQPIKRNGFTL